MGIGNGFVIIDGQRVPVAGGGDESQGRAGGTSGGRSYSQPNTRESGSYGRPYPLVYGTADVAGVCLWFLDTGKGEKSFQPDGVATEDGRARCFEVVYALAIGPVLAIDGITYQARRYGTGGLDLKYMSGADFTVLPFGYAWPDAPEVFLGDGTTTPWAHYLGSASEFRVCWPKLSTFRCKALGVPGGSGTAPPLRATVRGIAGTHANTKRKLTGETWDRYDAHPGDVIRDLLENTTYGLGLPAGTCVTWEAPDGSGTQGAPASSSFDTYCTMNGWFIALALTGKGEIADFVTQILAATNSQGFWRGSKFIIRPLDDIGAITAVGIGDDDLVTDGDRDAITVERQAWADTYNVVPVEYSQDTALRTSELVTTELNSLPLNVRRSPDVVSLPCIRSAQHAKEISAILSRRSFFHRARFEFVVTARQGVALEVGDFVSLTHAPLGLSGQLARVEEIDSKADGTYSVRAREWVTGAAVQVTTTPQGSLGLGTTPVPAADSYSALLSIADDGVISPSEARSLLDFAIQFNTDYREFNSGDYWKRVTALAVSNPTYAQAWYDMEAAFYVATGLASNKVYSPIDGTTDPAAIEAWRATLPRAMGRANNLPRFNQVPTVPIGEWWRTNVVAYQNAAKAMRAAALNSPGGVLLSLKVTPSTDVDGKYQITGTPSSSNFLRGDGSWAAPSAGVTSVSGTAPISSSGGATPAISIEAATTSAAGSMSAADKTKLDAIAVSGILKGSGTRNPGTIFAGDFDEWPITVTGAAVGDPCFVYCAGAMTNGLVIWGRVSAANTVTIRIGNHSSVDIIAPNATYGAVVVKP